MPELPSPAPPPRAGFRSRSGRSLIGAVIGFAGIYGIGGLKRNAGGDPACRPAVDLARKLAPLAHGEVAALTMATTPLAAAGPRLRGRRRQAQKALGLARQDGAGEPVGDLVRALPQGNARARRPAGQARRARISRWSRSISTPATPKSRRNFLKQANLTRLGYFSDQKAKVFQDLKAIGRALGMPTSVLVDGQGCEIATIAGPAEWDSDDAVKLITARKPRSDPPTAGHSKRRTGMTS